MAVRDKVHTPGERATASVSAHLVCAVPTRLSHHRLVERERSFTECSTIDCSITDCVIADCLTLGS